MLTLEIPESAVKGILSGNIDRIPITYEEFKSLGSIKNFLLASNGCVIASAEKVELEFPYIPDYAKFLPKTYKVFDPEDTTLLMKAYNASLKQYFHEEIYDYLMNDDRFKVEDEFGDEALNFSVLTFNVSQFKKLEKQTRLDYASTI